MIAALLLALVADAAADARGRAQELSGRLGLGGAPEVRGGTMARLRWIERAYGPDVRQAAELFLLTSEAVAEHRVSFRDDVFYYHAGWCLLRPQAGAFPGEDCSARQWRAVGPSFLTARDGPYREGLGCPENRFAWPTSPLARTEVDWLLPWVAQLAARVAGVATWDELCALISPSDVRRFMREPTVANPFEDPGSDWRDRFAEGRVGPDEEPPLAPAARRVWVVGFALGAMFRDLHVLDHLRTERPADLMARSCEDLLDAAEAWHDQLRRARKLGDAPVAGLPVASWPDGSRLERLVTRDQLEQEGVSMGHCVGGYWARARDGVAVVLSYRGPDGVSRATLEISPSALRVVQAQGPGNDPVADPQVVARLLDAVTAMGVSWLPGDAWIEVPDAVAAMLDDPSLPVDTEITSNDREQAAMLNRGRWFLQVLAKVHAWAAERDEARRRLARLARMGPRDDWPAQAARWGLDAGDYGGPREYAEELRAEIDEAGRTWMTDADDLLCALQAMPASDFDLRRTALLGGGARQLEVMTTHGQRRRLGTVRWWRNPDGACGARAVREPEVPGDPPTVAESDVGPAHAMRAAGILVSAAEAHARRLVRSGGSAAELRVPAQVALGSIAAHLRWASERGAVLDPDMSRALRAAR